MSEQENTMSAKMKIEIENLKCGGCEATILKGLKSIEGVVSVAVIHDTQTVEVDAPASLRDTITAQLRKMGYPERGTISGLSAGLANAKSYVSCAIGRVT
jgi:copper chaperone